MLHMWVYIYSGLVYELSDAAKLYKNPFVLVGNVVRIFHWLDASVMKDTSGAIQSNLAEIVEP